MLVIAGMLGCGAPNIDGDYRGGNERIIIVTEQDQVLFKSWRMLKPDSEPIVIPLLWSEGAFRGKLLGQDVVITKTDTGLSIIGGGKQSNATPFVFPTQFPAKADDVTTRELITALQTGVEKKVAEGSCGRRLTPERTALLRKWLASLQAGVLEVTTSDHPFYKDRSLKLPISAPAFDGPEGTVAPVTCVLAGGDSIGLMPDLGKDTSATISSLDELRRPWGNLSACSAATTSSRRSAATRQRHRRSRQGPAAIEVAPMSDVDRQSLGSWGCLRLTMRVVPLALSDTLGADVADVAAD
jgi:hypothetical protein